MGWFTKALETGANVGTLGAYGLVKGAVTGDSYDATKYGGGDQFIADRSAQWAGRREAADARTAPETNYSRADQDYGGQRVAAGLMQQAAEGRAPSVAAQQLQHGQAVAGQQATAMAASARGGGGNAMLAMRQAQQANVAGQAATNNQAAQLRAQEMAEARGSLGALSGQMRSQSAEQAQFQTQSALAARAQNDARAMGYEDLEHKLRAQQQNAEVGAQALTAQSEGAAKASRTKLLGGMMNAAGGYGGGLDHAARIPVFEGPGDGSRPHARARRRG